MDILRSKTPSMIRKEIYVFLLAYNLLRSLMWTAGKTYTTPPLKLSLQGTRHHLINFLTTFLCVYSYKQYQVFRTLLKVIVHKIVPERSGRVEPRVKKRRPKSYPSMTSPRALLRRRMMTQ